MSIFFQIKTTSMQNQWATLFIWATTHLALPHRRRNLLMPGENKYSFYRNDRHKVSLVSFVYIYCKCITYNKHDK